ncbi:hypothetical protein [Actinoplanes couchii]|nr:hypothetical protein [Actinoplanes couchii]MDR6319424.1 hypothetical protein [Actinoplanes couchii]
MSAEQGQMVGHGLGEAGLVAGGQQVQQGAPQDGQGQRTVDGSR